jgi:hypothetical protein
MECVRSGPCPNDPAREGYHGPPDVRSAVGNGDRPAILLRYSGGRTLETGRRGCRVRFHQLRTCRRLSRRPGWATSCLSRCKKD